MAETDRELLKRVDLNKVGSAPLSDAATEVKKAHRRLVNYVVPVAATAGTDMTYIVAAGLPRKVRLISAKWSEIANASAAGITNNQTYIVKKYDSAGANATTLASLVVSTATTAFLPRTITLTATASDLDVDVGSSLVVVDDQAGTGRSTPVGTCFTLDVEEI